jgi:phosphatidylglycerophosphate synthase
MPQEQLSGRVTIANLLTFSRLILLPIIVIAVATDQGWLAVGTMAVVLVTDLLDGRIARRLGQASQFGKNLDSTVDFVLIYSLFIAFYAAGRLETYQFLVLYLAMLSILVYQMVQPTGGGSVATTRFGKPVGALQYLYLLLLVAQEPFPGSGFLATVGGVVFAILAVTIGANVVETGVRMFKPTRISSTSS